MKQVAGRIPVIAGTGANSTREAIDLTMAAKAAGADFALLVVPYYNKPTKRACISILRRLPQQLIYHR